MHKLTSLASLLAPALLLAFVRTAGAAPAGGRLAVIIVADGDSSLSDSLTEVSISALARRGAYRLVGSRELRSSLGDILRAGEIRGCVERPDCLLRIGAAARADWALVGLVHRESDHFVVTMSLMNTRTAARAAVVSEVVPLDMVRLITAIRAGTASLFAPGEPPAPALLLRPVREGSSDLPPNARAAKDSPPRGPRWLSAYGYAAGGLAIVSLSAAAVTGSLAGAPPVGQTRAEAQADLGRLETYAGVANGLLVAGAALAVSAFVALFWHWRRD